MLRKTAAIAVLILILSSFTLGSTVQIQTVPAAGNEGGAPEQFTQECGLAAFPALAGSIGADHAQKIAGFVSQGHVQNIPDPENAFPPVAGFITTGRMPEMPETVIYESNVQDGLETEFSTLVVYLNDSRIERTMPGGFSFVAPGEGQPAGATGGLMVRTGHMPDNLTIKSRMSLLKPGGAPEFFDFLWERTHVGKTREAGSMAVFSGHLTIPGRNSSAEMASPFGVLYGSSVGTIEINGDLVVDLANLPVDVATADDSVQTEDIYNNQIAAGQTNWHSASVDSAVESVNVDLKWENPDGKLRLVVYTPDGKVLGPFYDDSDGKTDGRINLNIANPTGVASGEWQLKVTDMSTLGSDDYYVKTY
jgi:hypothetical protein